MTYSSHTELGSEYSKVMNAHHLAVSKIFTKYSLNAYCVPGPEYRTVDKTDGFPALREIAHLVKDSHRGRWGVHGSRGLIHSNPRCRFELSSSHTL